MTDWVQWFRYQLQASADGLVMGFAQIPPALLDQFPVEPGYLGTWQPIRHIWHVTEYERGLALPVMKQWLGAPMPTNDDENEDAAWAALAEKSPAALIAAFKAVRQEQIALLDHLAGTDWETPRQTPWGSRPLNWVVMKTFQHTCEHGDTLLRMSLWWSIILDEIAKAQGKMQQN
jgi:hypothetical protein